jgi:type VI secretion system protein ImpF
VAELTSQERLQPSLLDRLTDHEPSSGVEALEARVLTRQQLRAAVLRDLSWLFNTTRAQPARHTGRARREPHIAAEALLWEDVSEARASVLNFGMAAFSGESLVRMDLAAMGRDIKQSILVFEPRLDPETLEVVVELDGNSHAHHNQLKLVIRGHMWNQPVPLELLLSAAVDVETGQASVRDMRA